MFLRPNHRGRGVGRRLAVTIIGEAHKIGCRTIKLDTISTMTEAMGFYRSLGFRETEPYTHKPTTGAVFFQLELGSKE